MLNIPLGYLVQNNMTPIEALQRFLDPKDALQGLFGVFSKSLIKTWQEKNISLDILNWAINLAPNQNIDWINRFLSVEKCIPFYFDSNLYLQASWRNPRVKRISFPGYWDVV